MTSEGEHDGSEGEDRSVPSVGRAIEFALTLPFEVAARIIDSAPGGIEKARQQIVLARFIGKHAVDRGARELRDHLTGDDSSEARPVTSSEEFEPTITAESHQDHEQNHDEDHGEVVDSPSQESLALPDYDQLPASHVVAKLAGLSVDERDAIEMYETNGRHRRTVLGKLAQLRSDEAGE